MAGIDHDHRLACRSRDCRGCVPRRCIRPPRRGGRMQRRHLRRAAAAPPGSRPAAAALTAAQAPSRGVALGGAAAAAARSPRRSRRTSTGAARSGDLARRCQANQQLVRQLAHRVISLARYADRQARSRTADVESRARPRPARSRARRADAAEARFGYSRDRSRFVAVGAERPAKPLAAQSEVQLDDRAALYGRGADDHGGARARRGQCERGERGKRGGGEHRYAARPTRNAPQSATPLPFLRPPVPTRSTTTSTDRRLA